MTLMNRCKPKGEVSFIRANINHFSFVTGLLSKLTGSPEEVNVNVILNAQVYEGYRVKDPLMFAPLEDAPYHNVVEGSVFQCIDLCAFFAAHPTNFTVETWFQDGDNWQLRRKTHWGGVRWLDSAHTTDGWDSCCAGIATFVCDNKTVEDVNGETVEAKSVIDLRNFLKRGLEYPKHLEGYLG